MGYYKNKELDEEWITDVMKAAQDVSKAKHQALLQEHQESEVTPLSQLIADLESCIIRLKALNNDEFENRAVEDYLKDNAEYKYDAKKIV